MARIAGVDIPREKRLEISLTYIFGIGRTTAAADLRRHRASTADTRVRDLTDEEVSQLRAYIDENLKVEGDLRREVAARTSSARWRSAATRASATAAACPVRGQRTHTNARTRKGPKKTVAGKKKVVASNGQATRRGPSPPQEGTQERHLRRRAHQELVQQHDHHDHRPGGQRALVGLGRQRRLQGLPQVHAVRRAAGRRAVPPAGPWSTACARSTWW